MISRDIRRSTSCHLLAALVSLATPFGAVADEPVTLIQDGFEMAGGPAFGWAEYNGWPEAETVTPIADTQSVRFDNVTASAGKEPDVICQDLTFTPLNMFSEFFVDLADLDLPKDESFKIFTFLELDNEDHQAVAVKVGQVPSGMWISLEAMDDAENIISSPRHNIEGLLQGETLLYFIVTWDPGDEQADDGSARVLVYSPTGTLEVDLNDLENDTLAPDYVRLGFGELENPDSSDPYASFVLDNFVLWTLEP